MRDLGKAISPSARKGHPRAYAYYRCIGSDAYRFGGVRICSNKQLRTDLVDEAVWEEVCRLLEHPERLEQEYQRRFLQENAGSELSGLEGQIGRLRQGIVRLIDSYADGIIEKVEFEPRIARMRERLKQMELQAQNLKDEASLQRELRLILGRLQDFVSKIQEGLHLADWSTRRDIIRALVKRVEIDQEHVHVIFRINPTTPSSPSEKNTQSLQHCGGRDDPALRRSSLGWCKLETV
jgi:site-specific DNA recombinase